MRVLIGSCVLLLLTVPSWADVTEQEARAVVERDLGLKTDAMTCETVREGTPRARYRFWGRSSRGPRVEVSVAGGWVALHEGAAPPKALSIPAGTAIDAASVAALACGETSRLMGPLADELKWAQPHDLGGYWSCDAYDLPEGDPVRWGLRPTCTLSVDAQAGTIIFYAQAIPATTEPVEPLVSREDASRIARERLGAQLEPGSSDLIQNARSAGSLEWRVLLWPRAGAAESAAADGPSGPCYVGRVDALTGDYLGSDTISYEGASTPPAEAGAAASAPGGVPRRPHRTDLVPVGSHPHRDRALRTAAAICAGVLMLAVAAVLTVRSRRRGRHSMEHGRAPE